MDFSRPLLLRHHLPLQMGQDRKASGAHFRGMEKNLFPDLQRTCLACTRNSISESSNSSTISFSQQPGEEGHIKGNVRARGSYKPNQPWSFKGWAVPRGTRAMQAPSTALAHWSTAPPHQGNLVRSAQPCHPCCQMKTWMLRALGYRNWWNYL